MARANVGGSSNDATGSKLLKKDLLLKIARLNLSVDRVLELSEDKPSNHPIFLTLARYEKEIAECYTTLGKL